MVHVIIHNMKVHTSIILVATLFIAGGAYWYFFTGTGNERPLTAVGVTTNEAQQKFQILAGQLKSITFSTKVLDDPRFMSLVDLTTPIEPEPTGRIDPFAPIRNTTVTNIPVTKTTGH